MKNNKVIIYLFFLFFCLDVNGQLTKNENIYPLNAPKKTVLTGVLPPGYTDEKFQIYDFTNFSDPNNLPFIFAKGVDGKFVCEFSIANPVYLVPKKSGVGAAFSPGSIFKGNISTRFISMGIFIEPGDSINVEMKTGIDEENAVKGISSGLKIKSGLFDSIPFFDIEIFSGKGSEKLRCIQEIVKKTKLFFDPNSGINLKQKLEKSDSVINMIMSVVNKYKHVLTPAAETIIKANFLPMLGYDISEFLLGEGGELPENEINIHDFSVAKLYKERKNYMNSLITLDNPNLQYSFQYPIIIRKRAIIDYCIKNELDPSIFNDIYSIKVFDILNAELTYSSLKERILGRLSGTALAYNGLGSDGESMVIEFLKIAKNNTPLYKSLSDYYYATKQRLSKGGPIFQFALPDNNGRIIKMDDFKGKVVVLDFMYYGCPGCIKMIPSLTKVKSIFDKNNVIFISVSVDKKREDWMNAIGKYSVESSIQLNAAGGHNDPIVKYYNVVAYPQLVLIDKKGKLVTNNATRPNTDDGKELTALITQTLNER